MSTNQLAPRVLQALLAPLAHLYHHHPRLDLSHHRLLDLFHHLDFLHRHLRLHLRLYQGPQPIPESVDAYTKGQFQPYLRFAGPRNFH